MGNSNSENLVSSVNPANLKSFAGTMKEILRFHDIKQDSCTPAQVISYNRTTHVAKVQVLVQSVYSASNGVKYESGDIFEVPVLCFQHGMFWVDAPLYPGDTGYVIAGHRDGSLAVDGNSNAVLVPKRDAVGRDIEARTNNMGPQPPNTYLLHRYENGFFVPCRWGTVTVDEKDRDSMIWGRLKEKVTVDPVTGKKYYSTDGLEGRVTMSADGHVRVDNGTGLSIHSDEYRLALPGEIPDKTDENGVGWIKLPNVFIDPTHDLSGSDAKFREMIVLSQDVSPDTGKVRYVYKKHRILADEGVKVSGFGSGGNAYFSIYASEGIDGYSIRSGRVCVDNDKFFNVPEYEGPLDPTKEYYCVVRLVSETGNIHDAEIVAFDKINEADESVRLEKMREQFDAYSPDDFKTCRRWIVPIGSVDDEENITQCHVGAINLSSDADERTDFKIYVSGYDTEAGKYKYDIAAGSVQANGKSATATAVSGITLDTEYWCKVTYTVASQALTAEITSTDPTYPTDNATIVWKVKIGKATAEAIYQYHVGSLSLCVPNHTISIDNEVVARFYGTSDVSIQTSGGETPNDGVLTIKYGSSSLGTFSANQEDDEEITIPVPVETLNSENGHLNIIGDKKITVTTEGKTIRIGFDDEKEDPDPDPQHEKDPCEHDKESGNEGGVNPEYEDVPSQAGFTENVSGGVPATAGEHIGDDNCQHSNCV